jgi:hypothetical protein
MDDLPLFPKLVYYIGDYDYCTPPNPEGSFIWGRLECVVRLTGANLVRNGGNGCGASFGDNEKANEEWLREEKAKRELNHPNCPNWEPPGSLDFWRGEGQNGEGIGWEQVFYGEKWGKWASNGGRQHQGPPGDVHVNSPISPFGPFPPLSFTSCSLPIASNQPPSAIFPHFPPCDHWDLELGFWVVAEWRGVNWSQKIRE